MKQSELPPVEIPWTSISPEALSGIIDSFIFREGTDYGLNEISHERKVESVRRQLERREIKIVFDPTSESITIIASK